MDCATPAPVKPSFRYTPRNFRENLTHKTDLLLVDIMLLNNDA